jgi:hypothetical protein
MRRGQLGWRNGRGSSDDGAKHGGADDRGGADSGDPVTVMRNTATTTKGTRGFLTLRWSSGTAPCRPGDGGEADKLGGG